jgi:hypothetical protein
MMKRLSLLLGFLLLNIVAFGQAAGSLEGTVRDKDGNVVGGATVTLIQGDAPPRTTTTTKQGRYDIKPLDAGIYTLVVKKEGLNEYRQEGIQVVNGQATSADVSMPASPKKQLTGIGVKTPPKKVFISVTNPGTPPVITSIQVEKLASTNASDAISLRAGVYQAKSGSGISMGGGRTGGTRYMIDGMMVTGSTALAYGSVDAIQVNIGGLAANLGDASGGFARYTTKSFTPKTTGSFMLQRSIEGFSNNQFSFNLRGPLYKKINPKTEKKETRIGYSVAVGGNWDKDPDPSFYALPRVKDDVLEQLSREPLRAVNSEGRTIFFNRADYLTADDFTTERTRENARSRGLNANGNIVFKLPSNIELKIGGNGSYGANQGWSYFNSLFAPEAIADNIGSNYRGYVRFQQSLSKESRNEDGLKNTIGNAYYVVQVGYQRDNSLTQNPRHGANIFNYGYIGKFDINSVPFFTYDTTKGGLKGLKFVGEFQDGVTYTRTDAYNPGFAAYTNYVFDNAPGRIRSLDQIVSIGGLRNGDVPNSVFGLFNNFGSAVGGYNKSQNDQFSLNFDASFDINTNEKKAQATGRDVAATHAIEFGLYYEQRTNRAYGLAARGLWPLMRQLANNDIENFDFANPYWKKNGQTYTYDDVMAGNVVVSDKDSIFFNRLQDGTRSNFSTALRQKLGLDPNGTDYLNVDGIDPSNYSIDMFSADDLNGQGGQYVSYYGYDHKGNRSEGRASFEDFWRKKDAETGAFARPIAPYNPIYVAGYIQDNFKFRDIRFRLGVRVDRFDGNQKVLRDPYSLFAARTVNNLTSNSYKLITQNSVTAPDPINDADFKTRFADATVYVNSNNASGAPTIVGYRQGDVWYDAFGKEIANPEALKQYTGGVAATPYLQDKNDGLTALKSENFDVNRSFTDYKPRIAISPRISFTFPVQSDEKGQVKSMFYAHYDVVTQRPAFGNSFVTPDDYFYFNERAGQQVINNANLDLEKLVDYELGFQQQLNKVSAVTISAYYKERRNQIQLMNIVNAYPNQYQTFGNRDFSTTKGMTVLYDLRPSSKAAASLNLAYTLQFAEGTGSSSTSQRSLLSSGQPNLRTVLPLDFDSRHIISANLDYRFGFGEADGGPKVGKYSPFDGAGINILFKARAGEPYTKLSRAVPIVGGDFNGNTIVGSVNGSRRPWSYNTDIRLDKDIMLPVFTKKDAEGNRTLKRQYTWNVYAIVQNVFNTRNVLGVYPYTGLATDDGYLNSPQGQQQLSTIVTSQQAFVNYYNMYFTNPGNFVNPRRVFLGTNFSF